MQIVRIGDGSTKQHSAETIGAKAANLARMAALGFPVRLHSYSRSSYVPRSLRMILTQRKC